MKRAGLVFTDKVQIVQDPGAPVAQKVLAKAGKEIKCGRCGVKVEPGEKYFYFSVGFRGSKQIRCGRHHPRQSELCGSKMSGAYAANEGLEDTISSASCVSDIAEALEAAAAEIEQVRDEYQDSFDSLPENFQNGDQGSDIQEKIDALESYASTLTDKAEEVSSLEVEEEPADTDPGAAEDAARAEDADLVQQAKDLAGEALDEFEL